ncbi:MAG TPA: tetratricopeptide repeat protein [Anaeromyxobacteraceae bacterium]|jgi:tetratricopeptide (TPR) repeat protein
MTLPLRSLAAGAGLLALASALALRLAERDASRPYDVLHVPSGAAARWTALGHRTAVSDLYWLALVQYVGDSRASERGWERLLPLADLVTDLDPRHGYAYQTAGIVLSQVGRLAESDRILAKGVERGPPYWSFPFYLAFNAWFYRGDYPAAARWAELAALRPGASANISHLAVSLAAKGGTPDTAIEMLRELRSEVKDERTLERLDEQMRLALLERDAQMLERLAARFEAETGLPLASLEPLLWRGDLPALPPDPFGGRYEWNAGERRVRSSANPFRFELREEPRAAAPPPAAGERR